MFKHFNKILIILLAICLIFLSSCRDKKNTNNDNPTFDYIKDSDLVNDYVKWEGRYQYIENGTFGLNQVAIYNTATGFTIDFYGTYLKVRFIHTYKTNDSGTDIYYTYALDDETLPIANKNRRFCLEDANVDKTVTIIDNLDLSHHTIKCLKDDEAADAYTAIVSFETDGGFYKRDKEEDNNKLKFLVICASNGSGFGSLYYNSDESKVERTRENSSSLTGFMYLASRMYDADCHFVSQAGWSLITTESKAISSVIDYTGITTSNSVSGAQTTAKWDYNNYIPDVILFHIGGNDTPRSNFNVDTYKTAVVDIVSKLHNYYPNAKMLWIHSSTKCGAYALEALTTSDIINQAYIAECVIPQIGSDGWGAGEHASLKTHIASSESIANALEQNFQMSRTTRNITFEEFESILFK